MATRSKTTKTAARRKITVKGITPFLWYAKDAEKAAAFYTSLFKGSKVTSSSPMVTEFELAGQPFMALNGGPHYTLNPAYSMFVSCASQRDVDELWDALSKGGEKSMCGWLVDKFGLSWQIIPTRFMELMADEDEEAVGRVMQAMLKMQKLDIKKLEKAFAGK